MNDLNPPRRSIAPGEVLAGKYRVERVLGIGGMGMVVSACHLELGERVALKLLLPGALDCPAPERDLVISRFLREAQASTRIKSEHVTRVHDVGMLENGLPYIVMEYLEGCDLSYLIETTGRLLIRDAVDLVVQAMDAVGEAHAIGIVHRDLKPSNLFLTMRPDGSQCVKILDFGISKDASPLSLTQTGMLLGSPHYMAPEQIRSSKHVDARADIWSLGVILYELLAGTPPFSCERAGDGDSMAGILCAVLTEKPTALRARRPDVPVELEAVILRCLAKDPTQRYSNVAELAMALAPFGSAEIQTTIERMVRLVAKRQGSSTRVTPTPAVATSSQSPGSSTKAAAWGQTINSRQGGSTSRFVALTSAAMVVLGVIAFSLVFATKTADGNSHELSVTPAVAAAPIEISSARADRPSVSAPTSTTVVSDAGASSQPSPRAAVRSAPRRKPSERPKSQVSEKGEDSSFSHR